MGWGGERQMTGTGEAASKHARSNTIMNQPWIHLKSVIELHEEVSVLILLEANVLAVKEGTCKYGEVEDKKEPCGGIRDTDVN